MDTELLCMAVQGNSWPQAHIAIGTKSGNVLMLHGDFGTLCLSAASAAMLRMTQVFSRPVLKHTLGTVLPCWEPASSPQDTFTSF